jgi:hypothetical protein
MIEKEMKNAELDLQRAKHTYYEGAISGQQ